MARFSVNAGPTYLIVLTLITACGDGHLRGEVSRSDDGKTYFGVIDDNGGGCGPIFFDGKEWLHPIGEVAETVPGLHTIECGGKISFEVPEGVVFKFDYWGP